MPLITPSTPPSGSSQTSYSTQDKILAAVDEHKACTEAIKSINANMQASSANLQTIRAELERRKLAKTEASITHSIRELTDEEKIIAKEHAKVALVKAFHKMKKEVKTDKIPFDNKPVEGTRRFHGETFQYLKDHPDADIEMVAAYINAEIDRRGIKVDEETYRLKI